MSNRRYTEEYKAEAIKQITERGYKVQEVSRRLGVSSKSLYAWLKSARAQWTVSHVAPSTIGRSSQSNQNVVIVNVPGLFISVFSLPSVIVRWSGFPIPDQHNQTIYPGRKEDAILIAIKCAQALWQAHQGPWQQGDKDLLVHIGRGCGNQGQGGHCQRAREQR